MKRQIHHFKAAMAMFAAVSAALALPVLQQREALAKIGPYKSRGKGRGTPPRNHNAAAGRSRYMPHQGARECERRRMGGISLRDAEFA